MPVNGDRFMGVDLTLGETRPSACAVLDADGALDHLAMLNADSDIAALAHVKGVSAVGIDSPLGLPKGMCCLEEDCGCRSVHPFKGRVCERELLARGIALYVTTKRSFIKPMIYRAIGLAETLAASGCRVLEVYPYAAKWPSSAGPFPPRPPGRAWPFSAAGWGG